LKHALLDLLALLGIGRLDLEVIVELRVVRGDRERAAFHHAQPGQRCGELHDRIVRQSRHRVVAGARCLAQQHREHRNAVGAVRIDQARAQPEQAVTLRFEADVEAADVL
jgi:hypothetical protein